MTKPKDNTTRLLNWALLRAVVLKHNTDLGSSKDYATRKGDIKQEILESVSNSIDAMYAKYEKENPGYTNVYGFSLWDGVNNEVFRGASESTLRDMLTFADNLKKNTKDQSVREHD